MNSRSFSFFAAIVLALASIFVTRVLKAFGVAEVLAVLSCTAAVFLGYQVKAFDLPIKRGAVSSADRLVALGGLVGFVGLAVKGTCVALGIGVAEHDMLAHDHSGPNPLLQHIHHLFFNVGFLLMLAGGITALVSRRRRAGA